MSDINSLPNVDLNLLNEDLSAVDTTMPLLREGLKDLTISEITLEPSKDGAKSNLNITLKTTQREETTKDGVYVESGWPLYRTISLTPTPKYSADQIKRNLAEFCQADGVSSIYPLEAHLNKVIRCKVTIAPAGVDKNTGKHFAAKNEISAFIKIGV